MAEVKWIKLTTDMFDNRKIKHLRRLPEGNNIVLIWIMLLTLAGRCNSDGLIFLTENVPYTTKMLADELDFEESTVKLALEALEQLGMIHFDGFLCIPGWEEHQNIEGLEKVREQNRLRVEKYRDKQRLLQSNVTCNATCNVTVTQSNATDKEKEKDIEKDNKYIYAQKFDEFWRIYPRKKDKKKARQKFESLKNIEELFPKMVAALEQQKKSEQWAKDGGQFIPYPTTWLNGERWNDEPDAPRAPKGEKQFKTYVEQLCEKNGIDITDPASYKNAGW